jgi:membrane-bound lytic murein transglycosylase D
MKKTWEKVKAILLPFKKHLAAFCSLIFLVLVIKLFNYSVSDRVSDNSYKNYFNSSYKVFGIPLPKELDFCGEPVPVSDYTIRESLEKELLINTYWQSQTLLFLKRCNRWFPVIEPILKRHGIPQDFEYIALIESGFTNVVSPAGATGFWQLIDPTARNYGLEISDEVDERYNVEKSTEAACLFFKEAFEKYHNWTLVAASYNLGMGGIDKQIEKQRTHNYYDLYLNEETARYVFRILAIKDILKRPKAYGFELRMHDLYPPLPIRAVRVDSSITDLADFAIKQGTTYKILKLLNPWLRKNSLSNNDRKTYSISLLTKGTKIYPEEEPSINPDPVPDTTRFVTTAEITLDSLSHGIKHIVQADENISSLSKKYGVSEDLIRTWNHIDSKSEITIGQEIVILRANQ